MVSANAITTPKSAVEPMCASSQASPAEKVIARRNRPLKIAIAVNGRRIRGGSSYQARAYARSERADGADREPGEEDPEDEDTQRRFAPRSEALRRQPAPQRRRRRSPCRGLEPLRIELAPEGEHGGDDEPKRDEPEKDAEGDAACEQPASEPRARAEARPGRGTRRARSRPAHASPPAARPAPPSATYPRFPPGERIP